MSIFIRVTLATLFTATIGLWIAPTAASTHNAVPTTKPTPVIVLRSTSVTSPRLMDPPTTTTTAPAAPVAPTTTIPVPVTVSTPTTAPVAVQSVSENVHAIFLCIIAHESGGDPAAVNPSSGAGGLFQFLPSSWLAYGGGQFAPLPNLATADQQWQIALAAQAQSYWYPWVGTGCTPVG